MRLISIFIFTTALFAQSPSAFETHLAAGQAAMQQSRYGEADVQLRAAVAEAARPDPNRSPARAMEAYSALCDLDLLMSKYDEAVALAGKALDTGEAADVADLTPQLARLAGAYRAGGQTSLAVPVLERMLSIDLKLGADDPKVSTDYDKLGSAYLELVRLDDARVAYRRALDTRISRLGPDHIDVATSWVNLGVLEERNARAGDAQTDFETALSISEKNLGPESYGLTGILDRLGRLFSKQERYGDAEAVFQRSLAIREKILGARHSDVAPALDNLGMVYFFDKKYIEAEPLFQRALQIWTATQGPMNPLVAQSLDNLGSLYSAQKRYAEAEPLFKKALAIRETKDIESLSNLALLYEATSDLKRSDEYFQRAILTGEKGLGGDHPEVVDTLDEYAVMMHVAGRLMDAKKMEAHAKDMKEKLAPEKAEAAQAANVKVAVASSGGPGRAMTPKQ
jgi:tetratricopeptide (TPR) repeat protein